jgi:HK97 family phage portal protein
MNLVGVYRAVSIVATATKQLPISVWRGGVEIETPSLIKAPSFTQNRAVVIEETVLSLALAGNAYWLLQRSGVDAPVQAVEVLNPHIVRIEQDTKTGEVTAYRYGDKTYKPWQVKHLSLLRVPGSLYGLGPIQAAQASLVGARDVRDYASNWFSGGGVPSGVLKTDQVLDAEMADLYRERFEQTQADGRGVAVLGQGTSYQPIYLSPADAQFLETQNYNKTEIATLFGIPAMYMLADAGNNMAYANQQQVDVAFLKFTLSQYLVEIEQAFSDLLPRGQEARFVTEGLLRTDTKSRYESYALALTNGWMTSNEVRDIEGLPPISGGDELAKPSAAPVPQAQFGPEGSGAQD